MATRIRSVAGGAPLLDLSSFARRGPATTLTPSEVQVIARTVRRTPEVMVKVLRHGGIDKGAVGRHFDYLSRQGELPLETDEDQRILGRRGERALLEDWDLDIEQSRPRAALRARSGGHTPRLVHKLIFSMPARTPADKVLAAVKALCRQEFGLKHRYAMVLHTDEPHPHVHVVVKAVSEQGERLNIKKAHLRAWRAGFAQQLRAQGVAANATDRAVRGASGLTKTDPIYRAMQRGASTHVAELLRRLVASPAADRRRTQAGVVRMTATRREVEAGWLAVGRALEQAGERELAAEVRAFSGHMAPVRPDQVVLAEQFRDSGRLRQPESSPAETGPDRTVNPN